MPIISPWIFYLISVVEGVSCLFAVILAVTVIVVIINWISYLMFQVDYGDFDEEGCVKKRKNTMDITKKCASIGLICLIVNVFVPSKETMYTMLVAQTVTYENVEVATDTIKESVDYIFDKFNEEE